MPYTITSSCVSCDSCRPHCPTGAIKIEDDQFWIDPDLCNSCDGYYTEPQCVIVCPVNSPVPLQAKKGRTKVGDRHPTSPDLFANGRNNPFATAFVIWEACNLLAQRESLPWMADGAGKLMYHRPVNQGRGNISFWITNNLYSEEMISLSHDRTLQELEAIDIRSACMHLIYAAHATALDRPWEQVFTIDDRQIEKYLGLDKRKDLSKPAKLTLIKEIAYQACRITTSIQWPQQGKIQGFSLEENRLWHLLETKHHFQTDAQGCKHLIGLSFKIKAGMWAQYFLNKQGCKDRNAFYQYGTLPKSLLTAVMSIWQQHKGAARMMLWLLFKTKMGREQRITVPTLMRIAYGEAKVLQASSQREERKRLLRTFESDLEVLTHYGLKPIFDPVTYQPEIQPLWAKVADLPEDAEAALDFWINDGCNEMRLTDTGPRGKWNLLMNARILWFELPAEWEQPATESDKKRQRSPKGKSKSKIQPLLSAEDIANARKNQQISQRDLAQLIGKSQSWIRDLEKGRFQAKLEDQHLLRKVLGLA